MKEHKTLEGILSGTYKKYGWAYQPKIVGGCPHEHIALEAMQSYSDQQNAALRERVKELEALMQEFVDRVDRGEVRSKKTYAKFKEVLKS